jgi:hypothetical protein
MAEQQGADPIYTQADWSGVGQGIGSIFSQLFGGGSPAPQAPQAPGASRTSARRDHSPSPSASAVTASPPIVGDRPIAAHKARWPRPSVAGAANHIAAIWRDTVASPYAVATVHANTVAQRSGAERGHFDSRSIAARLEPGAQRSGPQRRGFDSGQSADGERASGHEGPLGASDPGRERASG